MPSLFDAHTMILIVRIFMNPNKLCLNQSKNITGENPRSRNGFQSDSLITATADLKEITIYGSGF